jgi:Domain of unknown function
MQEAPEHTTAYDELELSGHHALCLAHYDSLPSRLFTLTSLARLHLRDCELQSLPDSMGKLTGLTQLRLVGCVALKGLPDSICKLQQLKELVLRGCERLRSLPDNALRSVQRLALHGCKRLKRLPDSISALKHLRVLCLHSCKRLKRLPDSIDALQRLRVLCLHDCHHLERLPDSIDALQRLEVLCLHGCHHLESLPDSFGALAGLQCLDLSECERLKVMPTSDLEMKSDCKAVIGGCGLQEAYGFAEKHVTVGKLYWRDMVVRRLLGNPAARQQALQNLSIVAVLLATAAFAAFAQTPQRPSAFVEADIPNGMVGGGLAPAHAERWLRRFTSVQIAFVLSMAVVIYVLVAAVPEISDKNRLVSAARVWVGLALLSVMLIVAVVAAMFAFVAGAYSVYPSKYVNVDVLGPAVLAIVLVLWAFKMWAVSVWNVFPGWVGIRRYCKAWVAFHTRLKLRDVDVPFDDLDFLADRQLTEATEQNKLTKEVIKVLRSKEQAQQ